MKASGQKIGKASTSIPTDLVDAQEDLRRRGILVVCGVSGAIATYVLFASNTIPFEVQPTIASVFGVKVSSLSFELLNADLKVRDLKKSLGIR